MSALQSVAWGIGPTLQFLQSVVKSLNKIKLCRKISNEHQHDVESLLMETIQRKGGRNRDFSYKAHTSIGGQTDSLC